MELLALSAIITILLIAYKKEILSGVKKLSVEIKKIKKAKKPTEKPTEKAIKEYIIKIVDYNCSFVKLSDGACIKKDDIWNLCSYNDKVRKIIYPSGKVEYTPVRQKRILNSRIKKPPATTGGFSFKNSKNLESFSI